MTKSVLHGNKNNSNINDTVIQTVDNVVVEKNLTWRLGPGRMISSPGAGWTLSRYHAPLSVSALVAMYVQFHTELKLPLPWTTRRLPWMLLGMCQSFLNISVKTWQKNTLMISMIATIIKMGAMYKHFWRCLVSKTILLLGSYTM